MSNRRTVPISNTGADEHTVANSDDTTSLRIMGLLLTFSEATNFTIKDSNGRVYCGPMPFPQGGFHLPPIGEDDYITIDQGAHIVFENSAGDFGGFMILESTTRR